MGSRFFSCIAFSTTSPPPRPLSQLLPLQAIAGPCCCCLCRCHGRRRCHQAQLRRLGAHCGCGKRLGLRQWGAVAWQYGNRMGSAWPLLVPVGRNFAQWAHGAMMEPCLLTGLAFCSCYITRPLSIPLGPDSPVAHPVLCRPDSSALLCSALLCPLLSRCSASLL